MIKRNLQITLLLLFLTSMFASAQITIQTNQTAAQLAQMLVGEGVVLLNPQMNGTCPPETATGKFDFNGNLSEIGIDSGIVLTTGSALGISNPASFFANASFPAGTGTYAPGDQDLDDLLANFGSSNTTNDACVLEFDFVPAGDTISFDYVFASEEYPGFACSSFNDVFGFFISGPGFTGLTNIALVPGTTVPVAINSINDNTSNNPACTNMGPGSPFNNLYVDNSGGQNIAYNGFTTVLSAVTSVIPCDTFHLKLAIADAGDASYDSGVFLKAGSLNSIGINMDAVSTEGGNVSIPHCIRGCKPGEIIFSRPSITDQPLVIHYEIEGTADNGFDYEQIADSIVIPANEGEATLEIKGKIIPNPNGPKTVIINALSPYDCGASDAPNIIGTAEVTIFDSLFVEIVTDPITVCPDTEIEIEANIDVTLDYEWTPAALIPDVSGLTIHPSPVTTTVYSIVATMPGAPSTCPPVKVDYVATVEPIPQISNLVDETVCIADSININVYVNPEGVDYIYQWTPATFLRDDYSLNNKFFAAEEGFYTLTLSATTPIANCSSEDSFTLHVVPGFEFESVSPKDTSIDYGKSVHLMSNSDAVMWLWDPITYLDDPNISNPIATPLESMVYTLLGIDEYGCRDSVEVKIDVSYKPDYQLPNAFSPNGDGLNDVFKVANLKYEKLISFRIFNRLGQMVFESKDMEKGWDGNFKGKPAPTDVYFYHIEIALPGGVKDEIKGDITLIR